MHTATLHHRPPTIPHLKPSPAPPLAPPRFIKPSPHLLTLAPPRCTKPSPHPPTLAPPRCIKPHPCGRPLELEPSYVLTQLQVRGGDGGHMIKSTNVDDTLLKEFKLRRIKMHNSLLLISISLA